MARNITPRAEDYARWYQDVIKAAKLAEPSPVRGCMVIRPNGYALWEGIQRDLDRRFKETGHVNAYFPLLIPVSFLAKEAEHVEGFALECAVVTHSGLEKDPDRGGLRVRNQLEEPLVVRPTSETIIGKMYADWIQSYRDLPILINQWANVMRWELRTRLFLRTSEFLWQEGHTAHETEEEAQEETLRILRVYKEFVEQFLALPVLAGEKTERERFPGANRTYCIEAMMQDGKALQAGTSHNLGQNFARAFGIEFEGRSQKRELAWTTSWGASTRLIGALIMTHSDDEGLILPPRVAPTLGAVVPIYKSADEQAAVYEYAEKIVAALCGETELEAARTRASATEEFRAFFDRTTAQAILIDKRDGLRPGEKHFHWEQAGVPFRFEIGPRDVAAGKVVIKSRLGGDKEILELSALTPEWFQQKLEAFQQTLFDRALACQRERTHVAESRDDLYSILEKEGGFVRCFLTADNAFEDQVKAETKATVRLVYAHEDMRAPRGTCIRTGEECDREVVFGVAY